MHRRSALGRRLTLGMTSVLVPVAVLTACADADTPTPAAASDDCPRTVSARLDASTTAQRHDVYLPDLSGSTGSSMESLRPQIEGIVTDAVNGGATLTVSVVGISASDLKTVLNCPALTPLVNDEDARAQATQNLVTAVTDAVVDAYPEVDPRVGSDIYGALLAESGRLPQDAPVRIISTSDGMQWGATDVPLQLPGVTVEMYGIGRMDEHSLDTTTAAQVRADWTRMLTQAGATPVIRFTPYTPGQVGR
jgi:hypothetical protein